MDYQKIIDTIGQEVQKLPPKGDVASYIPELAKIPPDKLGIFLSSTKGEGFGFGDCQEPFSIQSISKVLSLALAYEKSAANIWERVGVEPSGNPFNSLIQLEHEHGIPRNPLINSGALVICDILLSLCDDPYATYLQFIRQLVGSERVSYSFRIAQSEKDTGFRNVALVNFMRSFGNIRNPIEKVLDFYFMSCSVEMSCQELAKAFNPFANGGRLPNGKQVIGTNKAKRINAIMQTCGFYDEAGEFTYRVGLPGKSGVGGGIVAVSPGLYSVAVWSPRLNKKGNSYLGTKVLEEFTSQTNTSIF